MLCHCRLSFTTCALGNWASQSDSSKQSIKSKVQGYQANSVGSSNVKKSEKRKKKENDLLLFSSRAHSRERLANAMPGQWDAALLHLLSILSCSVSFLV